MMDGKTCVPYFYAQADVGRGFEPESVTPAAWIEPAEVRGYDWWARHVEIWKATKEPSDCDDLFVGDEVTQNCRTCPRRSR